MIACSSSRTSAGGRGSHGNRGIPFVSSRSCYDIYSYMDRRMKVLFVLLREVCDCSVDSFYIDYRDGIVDEWLSFEEERPKVCHYRAILFRDRDSLNKRMR